MKLYLAGPLFTTAERAFNTSLAAAFVAHGHEVWLPQAHEPRQKTSDAIFLMDVEGMDWAEVIIANIDGPDVDSGTAWECAYGYCKDKPVFLYRTDFRAAGDAGQAPCNLMIFESSCHYYSAVGKMPFQIAAHFHDVLVQGPEAWKLDQAIAR